MINITSVILGASEAAAVFAEISTGSLHLEPELKKCFE